uniref:CSON006036 protein n=1 Tax=Culicoides sonorensis TaxID=179676 RepID=A0A336LJZ7_CULSO
MTTLKADLENKLDKCIMSALDSLLRNYTASDEFMAIYQEKMFIKNNTNAFIHTTHYLFTVLDEKEFKKRFYWPIKEKKDEGLFRTSTVDYINYLIDQGKLKMDKIKAMHVVIPGGIKFMKFLLKVILLVVNEVVARKNATNIEVKNNVGEYICKELLEKNALITEIAVDLRKIVASDISEIKKKTEIIDQAINLVFENVIEIKKDERSYFFDAWAKVNSNKFKKIQEEQKNMRKCIANFDRICKHGQHLLKPQEFKHPRYNSENVKEAIKSVEDKLGFTEEEESQINSYIDIIKVIKLVHFSIEHVVALISQCPVRDLDDMKVDSAIVNDLHSKIMNISMQLKTFLHKLNDDLNVTKVENSSKVLVRDHDPQLLQGFFGTPPISINTKESDDLSMVNMLCGRMGNRDMTKLNMSHSRLLQMSQKELKFSPKHERSVFISPKPITQKTSRQNKPKFVINSAALFGSKPPQKTFGSMSRLDSYSMVMPSNANVFSSTVLDQSSRGNQTPPNINLENSNISIAKSDESAISTPSNPEETLIEKAIPKPQFLTPQTNRISINSLLSPKIQLNDQTLISSQIHQNSGHKNDLLTKSASPSNRVKANPVRSLLNSHSFSSQENISPVVAQSNGVMDSRKTKDATIDLINKFDTLNVNFEEEDLMDISETLLVND